MDAMESRTLLARLERDAHRIAAQFSLHYRTLEAARPGVRSYYGLCTSDGVIRIRLRHATTGRALKYSSLVNTLCHELAHLRHFNHGPRFQAFYGRLLDFARAQGIYRPGSAAPAARPAAPPPAPRRPLQLDLF